MVRGEYRDGPYLRYLRQVRRRVGEQAWTILCALPSTHADAWLRGFGILPYPHSVEGYRHRIAHLEGTEDALVEPDWSPESRQTRESDALRRAVFRLLAWDYRKPLRDTED